MVDSREQTITIDQLVNDPHWMLWSYNIGAGLARFHYVDESLPPKLCFLAEQCPHIDVPLNTLLSQTFLYQTRRDKPVHFVWMTDFCTSTLYARALHAIDGFYVYNENMIFAALAQAKRAINFGAAPLGSANLSDADWQKLLRIALFFQAKPFRAGDTVVVKEWPLSNFILPDILAADERAKGIFLYAELEEYLIMALKDPRRRELARDRVSNYFVELHHVAPFDQVDIERLDDSQVIALHWLYLMYLHRSYGLATHPRMRTLHNRLFVEQPTETLTKTAEWFDRSLTQLDAEAIVSGPVFSTHAKEPGKTFDFSGHWRQIAHNREVYRDEVDAGLRWSYSLVDSLGLTSTLATPL